MKVNYICMALACSFIPGGLAAQQTLEGKVNVEEVHLTATSDSFRVSMTLDLSELELKSNRMIELFPTLLVDNEKVSLPSVKVMGRRQFISHQRNRKDVLNGEPLYWVRRENDTRQLVNYQTALLAEKGVQNIRLYLNEDLCGCKQLVLDSQQHFLAEKNLLNRTFIPQFAYLQPQVEVRKQRNESGLAYISFPVNGTNILLDYQENTTELAKIEQTLQKILNDADVKINQLAIKGYASPEGSLEVNERLAQLRTEALAAYLINRYKLDETLFDVESGAEDWEGLRAFIQNTDWNEKQAMLDIMDGKGTQDVRERRLQEKFPEAYHRLREVCYPKLRHTDYVITYTVRAFQVEEAKKLILEQPQKLSLQEMYAVAQTYEVGSDAYNEVFEIAVRMYPNDGVANLNAANTALQKKDVKAAEKYLMKVGDTPEAKVARGVLAYLKKDIVTAERLFREAEQAHVDAATYNLKQLLEFKE